MKKLIWLAFSSWMFFFSFAEAAPDPRAKIAQDDFERFLNRAAGLFSSGRERLYKGQMKVVKLKTTKEVWNGDVVGMAAGSHMVVSSAGADPSKKLRLMILDLYQPSWKSPLEETLLRFEILGSFGNHGRAELGDTSAFKEIEVVWTEKPNLNSPTGKEIDVSHLLKFTTHQPLATDFGSGDDYSFEGNLEIVDPAAVTLKDMVSAPPSTFAGEPRNEFSQQYMDGNLVLVGDKGELAATFSARVSHTEALTVNPTLPPCVNACGDEVPYSFEYLGVATISAGLKDIQGKTSKFTDLKCP